MSTRQSASERPRLCANCYERTATKRFVANGGVFDLLHGAFAWWCEVCVLRAQIEHAESVAATLPEKRARLAELVSEELATGA